MKAVTLLVTEIASPPGAIVFVRRGGALSALCFRDYWTSMFHELERRFGALDLRPDPDGGGLERKRWRLTHEVALLA
jgi:hypothetical protein